MGLGTYFLALGVTIAVEIPLLLVCTPSRDRARVWQIALLLNLFTHPLANLAYWEGLAPLLIIEVGVVVVEALGVLSAHAIVSAQKPCPSGTRQSDHWTWLAVALLGAEQARRWGSPASSSSP